MLIEVKKKEKGEKWKMLRTHIPFTLAHDPSDELPNYQETLHLRLQYECVRHAITPTRAPHTPSEKLSKVRFE